MLAIVPFDWQVHDTHFVVAHLHYVLVGGFVFPMLAAAYYYLPHFTGRQPLYGVGKLAFWLIFVGFNMTFLIMHLTGLLGMPRRWATFPTGLGWDIPNLVSSIGGFITTTGFALFAVDILFQLRFGKPSKPDPWNAETLEWCTALPPRAYAFASLPQVSSRTPLRDAPDLRQSLERGEGFLARARNGWQETLVVEMATGAPQHIAILPRATFLPLWTGVAIGAVVLSLLFKIYWAVPLALALVVGLLLMWSRDSGHREDHGLLDVGHGLKLPVHAEVERTQTWWGVLFLLVADGTIFASLVFGALFLWLVAPGWPAPATVDLPLAKTAILAAAALATVLAGRMATRVLARSVASAASTLATVAAAHAVTAGMALWLLLADVPTPTTHAYLAITAAFLAYVVLHAGIGAILAGLGVWRCRAGYVSARRSGDLHIGILWNDFTAATALLVLLFLAALPWLLPLRGMAP